MWMVILKFDAFVIIKSPIDLLNRFLSIMVCELRFIRPKHNAKQFKSIVHCSLRSLPFYSLQEKDTFLVHFTSSLELLQGTEICLLSRHHKFFELSEYAFFWDPIIITNGHMRKGLQRNRLKSHHSVSPLNHTVNNSSENIVSKRKLDKKQATLRETREETGKSKIENSMKMCLELASHHQQNAQELKAKNEHLEKKIKSQVKDMEALRNEISNIK